MAHIWAHKGPYGPIYGPIRAHMGPNPDRAPTRTGPQPGLCGPMWAQIFPTNNYIKKQMSNIKMFPRLSPGTCDSAAIQTTQQALVFRSTSFWRHTHAQRRQNIFWSTHFHENLIFLQQSTSDSKGNYFLVTEKWVPYG